MLQLNNLGFIAGVQVFATCWQEPSDDWVFSAWDKNYLQFSVGSDHSLHFSASITIEDVTVTLGSFTLKAGETVTIDITELLRGGDVSKLYRESVLFVETDDDDDTISLYIVDGELWTASRRQIYPNYFKLLRNKSATIPIFFPLEYEKAGNEDDPSLFGDNKSLTEENLNRTADRLSLDSFYLGSNQQQIRIEWIDDTYCETELAVLTWRGHHGLRKSWVFDVENREYSGASGYNILTDGSQYDVRKSKTQRYTLRQSNCNYRLQAYLSDLVQASYVEAYLVSEERIQQVNVRTQSLSVEDNIKDIRITLDFAQYDSY